MAAGNFTAPPTVHIDPRTGRPTSISPVGSQQVYQPGVKGPTTNYAPPTPKTSAPTGTTAQAKLPGLLDTPGTGEQWWDQNGSKLAGNRQLDKYWQGISGNFNQKVDPTNSRTAWASYQGTMSQPGQGMTNARDISQQQRNTPGTGETTGNDVSNYFRQQGQGEANAYGMLGNFNKAGVAEGNYGNVQNTLKGITYGDQGLNDIQNRIGTMQGNTSQFNNNLVNSGFANQSPVADEYGYFANGLRDKSYSEQMYESGNGGLIDPYARAQEKQTKKLRDAAAAHGFFGSGAAMRSEEELGADIGAQEANARIALAQQADQQRLARTGAAQQFTSAADQSMLGHQNLGLQSATAADTSERANSGQLLDAYGQASQEALAKVGLETNAASIAQNAAMDRMFKGGQLGLQADQTGQARENSLFSTAQGMQNLQRNRMNDSATNGIAADDAQQRQLDDYFKTAGTMDTTEQGFKNDYLSQLLKGGDVISHIDDTTHQDLMDQNAAAAANQNLFQGRERGALSDISGVQSQIADMVFKGLDDATRGKVETQIQAINGALAAGKIDADHYAQMTKDLFSSAGLSAQAYETYMKYNKPGAPAPAAPPAAPPPVDTSGRED